MKTQCFYLLLTLVILPIHALTAPGGKRALLVVGPAGPGGWFQINITEPHVKEIGVYAVEEYNKESKSQLKFASVVNGEAQAVAGVNYRLIVATKDGALSKNYQAVVWEKVWEHFRNLTSFTPVMA